LETCNIIFTAASTGSENIFFMGRKSEAMMLSRETGDNARRIEHQEFVELCAFHTAGSISDEQLQRLDEHLELCADCRRVLEEFQEIASMGLPSLASDFAALPAESEAQGNQDRTQERLLARIENQIKSREPIAAPSVLQPRSVAAIETRSRVLWHVRQVLPYAASIAAAALAGFYAYHLGANRISSASEPKLRQIEAQAEQLQKQVAEVSGEREALRSKQQGSDSAIAALTAEVKTRTDELAALKAQQKQLADSVASATSRAETAEAKTATSEADRTAVARRLADAQSALDAVQKRLELARQEQASEALRTSSYEDRLNKDAEALKERDQTIQQQRDLLAHDRDIRDLIGARDLYVAEVNDVDRDAKTQTPFGRVFFTKGKSLIFYAYDLDQQSGLKRAVSFEAWGRRGASFQEALPLGMLYLDSESHKRWVLKFDDPKTLAKIDAVFVTVEPHGGSQKPSGKPLLFAYLKVEPNHP
jgi:hypothetical protein